jgi:hypothetical protein
MAFDACEKKPVLCDHWHPFTKRRNGMSILQPGTQAPAFSLAAHSGDSFALSAFHGRKTVVCFLPFAFTGG